MREEERAFGRLVKPISSTAKVLDVGSGELAGGNTSNHLVDKFGPNYTGIQIKKETIERYKRIKENVEIIHGDFYKTKFKGKYDLVVLDLDIINNVTRDWEGDGIKKSAFDALKTGGHVICYVMSTTKYGSEDDGLMLERHHEYFWEGAPNVVRIVKKCMRYLEGFDIVDVQKEEARDYIYWVKLRKL